MRKQIVSFVTLLILSIIPITTKAQNYNDLRFIDNASGQYLTDVLNESSMYLELLEWGIIRDGVRSAPNNWRGKNQIWAWIPDHKIMIHYNTDDGTFV